MSSSPITWSSTIDPNKLHALFPSKKNKATIAKEKRENKKNLEDEKKKKKEEKAKEKELSAKRKENPSVTTETPKRIKLDENIGMDIKVTIPEWYLINNPHKTVTHEYRLIHVNTLLEEFDNYYPLEHPILDTSEITSDNIWSIVQRTTPWFDLREGLVPCYPNPKVSASMLPLLTGMFLEEAREFFGEKYYTAARIEWINQVVHGKDKDFGWVDYKLKHGNKHEMNGTLSLLKLFAEKNGFKFEFHETGSYIREIEKGLDFLASPDGLFKFTLFDGRLIVFDGTIETKCSPCPWQFYPSVGGFNWNDVFPPEYMIYYYVPQSQMQMYASRKFQGLFDAWTPAHGSTIFLTTLHYEYVELIKIHINFVRSTYYKKPKVVVPENPFEPIAKEHRRLLELTKEIMLSARKWELPNMEPEEYTVLGEGDKLAGVLMSKLKEIRNLDVQMDKSEDQDEELFEFMSTMLNEIHRLCKELPEKNFWFRNMLADVVKNLKIKWNIK